MDISRYQSHPLLILYTSQSNVNARWIEYHLILNDSSVQLSNILELHTLCESLSYHIVVPGIGFGATEEINSPSFRGQKENLPYDCKQLHGIEKIVAYQLQSVVVNS